MLGASANLCSLSSCPASGPQSAACSWALLAAGRTAALPLALCAENTEFGSCCLCDSPGGSLMFSLLFCSDFNSAGIGELKKNISKAYLRTEIWVLWTWPKCDGAPCSQVLGCGKVRQQQAVTIIVTYVLCDFFVLRCLFQFLFKFSVETVFSVLSNCCVLLQWCRCLYITMGRILGALGMCMMILISEAVD